MRPSTTLTCVLLIGSAAAPLAQPASMSPSTPIISVMTRNVYHGVNAEIFDVTNARSLDELKTKVAAVYEGYGKRDFHERAAALALEVYLTRPDLIGLQEAILVRTQTPGDQEGAATPATSVELDYVQILLDALARRGLAYTVVKEFVGLDIELPSAPGNDVRHTDREVILARADLKPSDLTLTNPLAGSFAVNCAIPVLGRLVPIRRGWVSVDATVRGRRFRFVSTHLDGDCPLAFGIQQAQAAEVLAGPAATGLPLVLVGDFNSPADGTGVTYNTMTGATAGLTDTWIKSGFGVGWTCCQDDDLLNIESALTRRIDLVLFRGPFTALRAMTVGDHPLFKTGTGLWPSDHAGVVARLLLRP